MIRPLRQFHYRTMITIGIVLPVAFVAGIAVRKAMPLRATPSLAAAFRDSEVQVWERNDLFSKVPVEVRLLHGPAWYAITFSTGRGFAKPDLLVSCLSGWLPKLGFRKLIGKSCGSRPSLNLGLRRFSGSTKQAERWPFPIW